jgi:TrmH family RNA methyltransferase
MTESVRVVLVEPKYQINLGYIARALKNFGMGRLYIVNPRCDHNGKTAIKYAKHAHDLLENAAICRSIKEATKGTVVVGTTAIWHKSHRSFLNVYSAEKAASMYSSQKVSILIGRDDTGLTKEELSECSANIFINANRDYPVLNISHALAIILYEFTKDRMKREHAHMGRFFATSEEKERAFELFRRLIRARKDIKRKDAVLRAFRHVIDRSVPTRKEINALAIALSDKTSKERKEGDKNRKR